MPFDEGDRGDCKADAQIFFAQSNAAGALEGVARWRLPDEKGHQTVQDDIHTLRRLVYGDYLEENQVAGARAILQSDKRKRMEKS